MVGTITETALWELATGACYIGVGPVFNATGLTHFEYSASGPMVLYIVTLATFVQWQSWTNWIGWNGGCNAPSYSGGSIDWYSYALGSAYPLTGSFDRTLPENTWLVILIAPTSATNPTATVTAGSVSYIQKMSIAASVATIYTTESGLTTFTSLQVATNLSTFGGAAIGGIVVLFAVVYVLTKRRKREEPKPSKKVETTEQEVPPTEQEAPTEMEVPEQETPTEQFCINCGTKLTANSKFCNNCGVKQP